MQNLCDEMGMPSTYWFLFCVGVQVIGLRGTPGHGSLREWGVAYRELPLAQDGDIDWDGLASAVTPSALDHCLMAVLSADRRVSAACKSCSPAIAIWCFPIVSCPSQLMDRC